MMSKHKIYHNALSTLIKIKRPLNIIVVGANDGKINDPIYDFAIKMSDSTKILLIEPSKQLLPYLLNNYATHDNCQVANCAIGQEGTLTLYAVKNEYWKHFRPAYAKQWPVYRAATGVTTAIKSHLEKCLSRQNLVPDEAMETLKTPSKELKTLIDELKWPVPIDVLQIDAEGYDDMVIYNSNLSYTKPKLIYFESHNTPTNKDNALKKYLYNYGYRIYRVGGNSLAIYKKLNLTSIVLNITVPIWSGFDVINRFIRKIIGK